MWLNIWHFFFSATENVNLNQDDLILQQQKRIEQEVINISLCYFNFRESVVTNGEYSLYSNVFGNCCLVSRFPPLYLIDDAPWIFVRDEHFLTWAGVDPEL